MNEELETEQQQKFELQEKLQNREEKIKFLSEFVFIIKLVNYMYNLMKTKIGRLNMTDTYYLEENLEEAYK